MKSKLKEYLDAEIPEIRGKTGIVRLVSFFKEMRYNPSSNAIFLLRYCYVHQESKGIRKCLRMHYNRLLVNRYGIYLNLNNEGTIGKGLFLPHPTSIVFGDGVNIGENCIIYQNVTFGAKKRGENGVGGEVRGIHKSEMAVYFMLVLLLLVPYMLLMEHKLVQTQC